MRAVVQGETPTISQGQSVPSQNPGDCCYNWANILTWNLDSEMETYVSITTPLYCRWHMWTNPGSTGQLNINKGKLNITTYLSTFRFSVCWHWDKGVSRLKHGWLCVASILLLTLLYHMWSIHSCFQSNTLVALLLQNCQNTWYMRSQSVYIFYIITIGIHKLWI